MSPERASLYVRWKAELVSVHYGSRNMSHLQRFVRNERFPHANSDSPAANGNPLSRKRTPRFKMPRTSMILAKLLKMLLKESKSRQTALLNNKCRRRELPSVCDGRENLSLFIMAVGTCHISRDLSETKGFPLLIQVPQLQMEIPCHENESCAIKCQKIAMIWQGF
ncbi:hypothetical protein CDAR_531091 [Caerostris darwini]|uniref:Uncharacterized protein n=1 Tax=Caerostris darwini TaxID=1538125 RepID=A0AAV4Q359_9ARAC|nr:hypothetical protein CDAR_531091 [Caerostris darwini]